MEVIKMIIEDMDDPGEIVRGPEIELFSAGGQKMNPYEAGREIDRKIREELDKFPDMSYQQALQRILDRHPALKAAWATGVFFPSHDQPINPEKVPDGNPKRSMDFYTGIMETDVRAEVDERVKKYMAKNTALDYAAAMQEVFAADPELKEKYSRS